MESKSRDVVGVVAVGGGEDVKGRISGEVICELSSLKLDCF
jgi:hypothetical protein